MDCSKKNSFILININERRPFVVNINNQYFILKVEWSNVEVEYKNNVIATETDTKQLKKTTGGCLI